MSESNFNNDSEPDSPIFNVHSQLDDKEKRDETNHITDVTNEYYKLKAKYEGENMKQKKKILNNKNLSWIEKQREFQQLKPKCINCKRPGGSIFSNKFNVNTQSRELQVICGVTSSPCKLNILISLGKYQLLPDTIKYLSEEIHDDKNKVIDNKNKNVFGFISPEEVLTVFSKLKEIIKDDVDLYELYLSEYLDIIDNPNKLISIERKTTLFYEYISKIKESIKNFNLSDNNQYIRDVVEIYKNKLVPIMNDIMNLKYKEKNDDK